MPWVGEGMQNSKYLSIPEDTSWTRYSESFFPFEEKPRRASFLPHNSVIVVLVAQSWLDNFAVPWTVAHQAPLSIDSLGKNTGVGCHFPSDLPNPGIKPESPALAGRCFTAEPPGKPW